MESRNVSGGEGLQYSKTDDGIASRNRVYSGNCKCGAKRVDKQLGLEPTYQKYIDKLVAIFDEVKRVLKDTGSCWVNIGDTYGGGAGGYCPREGEPGANKNQIKRKTIGMEKSLIGIPERFMLAMIDNGWILRNKIVWHKKNCMPSSASDRFTVDWEALFFSLRNHNTTLSNSLSLKVIIQCQF